MRQTNENIFFNLTQQPFMSVYWAMHTLDDLVVKENQIKKIKIKNKRNADKIKIKNSVSPLKEKKKKK